LKIAAAVQWYGEEMSVSRLGEGMREAGQNRRDSADERRAAIRFERKPRVAVMTKGPKEPTIHRSEISEAEIDDTLADSFPASDPPFWNSGIDRHTRRAG
jgi:hypothetical protein